MHGIGRWFACAVGLSFACACGGADVGTEEAQQSAVTEATKAGASSSLRPVASLALPNGNVVEFYDLGTGAIVSELGKAYTAPALNAPGSGKADDVTGIWRSLAPDVPVPAALEQVRQRLANLPPSAQGEEPKVEPVASQTGALALGPGNELLAAPNGCNNGCCDYEWLATFFQCQNHGDYKWFFYNYGSSYQNRNSIIRYEGLVCAAAGVSSYKVTMSNGAGGTWSIPAGYYRTYYWLAGYSCIPWCGHHEKDMRSSVNTPTTPALHTYCGFIER